MARINIRRPQLLSQAGNMHAQKPPVPDGSNSFSAFDLVQVNASGQLQIVPNTSATALTKLVWGMTPDSSKAPTDVPPTAFFGENHYCFDLTDAVIEMNLTNAAGGVGDASVNNGNAGPTMLTAGFVIGGFYGLKNDATNYSGVQMVNVAETTNTVVQVIGVAPNQTTADFNPRVLCKIPKAQLQG